MALIAGIIAACSAILWLVDGLPNLDRLPGSLFQPSVRIYDRNGRLLYESIKAEGGRHTVVPLDEIPLPCQLASIATEDRSFYTNPGVDTRGMIRAIWINLRSGQTVAGGSTITQQVARNLVLHDGERSIRRKMREVIIAWELNRQYSKSEILALYLNQTYYGGMAYGVEAAAQTFFGKSVERLDLAECALIAGLPQSPARYNPFTDFEAAKTRQGVVLELMKTAGFIDLDQLKTAQDEPLILSESPYPIQAPHFVMMVRQEIDARFTPEQIQALGGLVVRTSLDLNWQKHAENAIRNQLTRLSSEDGGMGHRMNNAALVALDPTSGDVLAMVGSPDYFDADHAGAINMAISPRQPGSALKPFVYAAALDPANNKVRWTAATMILDVRTAFHTQDQKVYIPANYDLKEHGPVLIREALASSLNIPAVKTLEHVGLEDLFSFTSRLGITTLKDPEEYDLSLALGGGSVRLLELSAAYGAFANSGYRVYPRLILDAVDASGNPVYVSPPSPRLRVIDERVAWLISDILSDSDARRIGFGANSILRLDRPAAVKTGTTSNFHDNWTVGYTPGLVVGVWSGNTDYQPMREVNGLSGAAPIWHEFMRTVLTGQPEQNFSKPPGMIEMEICKLSGQLSTKLCPYRRSEWFIPGTEPSSADSMYREILLDSTTGKSADHTTPKDRLIWKTVLDLPPEASDWAHQQGMSLYSDFLQGEINKFTNEVNSEANEIKFATISPLYLTFPVSGSEFRLDPDFPRNAQRIRLTAVCNIPFNSITFWIDGKNVGEAKSPPYELWWTLEVGFHTAWAVGSDSDGRLFTSPEVNFQVNP